MLIAPAGAAFAGGASVASGTAVGELVLPLDGAFVAAGASDGTGVAVADDPQANNSTTNKSITALGKCRKTRVLIADCGKDVLPRCEILIWLENFRKNGGFAALQPTFRTSDLYATNHVLSIKFKQQY